MKQIYSTILFFIFLLITSSSFGSPSDFFSEQNRSGTNIIDEEKSISVKKMYPNPVKEKLTVDLFVKIEGELTIRVFDILGNEILKKNAFANHSGLNTITIDFSDLRPGIYILKAIKETDAVSVRIKKQ